MRQWLNTKEKCILRDLIKINVITFKKDYGFWGRMLQKLIYPLRKILGVALDGEKLNFGFHGMTTAGFKVITAKDRELTVMFHYDSYEVDGKKYSKEAFINYYGKKFKNC